MMQTADGSPENVMSMRTKPDTREEIGRLGREIYLLQIRPRLLPEDKGKYVAVDVDSGDYELDASDYQAGSRLHARRPSARIWLERAGYPAAYRIAGMKP
jgi:hypothetical protein